MKAFQSPLLRTANCEIESVARVAPFIVCISDVNGGVGKLAVDVVLGKPSINCCMRGIFPFERKTAPLHSLPVAVTSTQKTANAIIAGTEQKYVRQPPVEHLQRIKICNA